MKYEEVIQRIDKYKESDKHQPIIVDLPNVQVYNKLVKHYNVGDSINLLKDASLFCKEESLPVMDKLLYSLSTMDGMIFSQVCRFTLDYKGRNHYREASGRCLICHVVENLLFSHLIVRMCFAGWIRVLRLLEKYLLLMAKKHCP